MKVAQFLPAGAWFALALLLASGFASLGCWQLGRAHWKERLLRAHQDALSAPELGLAPLLERWERLPTRMDRVAPQATPALPLRARAQGRYLPDATLLWDNHLRGGRPGAMVFSLFQVEGVQRLLLVNRGWVPLDAHRRVAADWRVPSGLVAVQGLLAPPPTMGLRLQSVPVRFTNPPQLLSHWDVDRLQAAVGKPMFHGVLLLDASAPAGFLREWSALPNTLPPERHYGYAVQWFALAVATLLTYCVLWLKSKKKTR